ncbi:uncharacterized protein EV422DRAFT_606920 [Fimicolochytrium jonesii]|uniref:uncharacterized protein n=1 Tax=Fimicolochytrium jonesii TaxID=1396493 RepID=UPI0022FEFFE6|nr:uncharacterized protein EV422DRAFT_606920 [Fimicolochytrium jonesii]KAI8816917.1 hypothetical protein EV422DRAFT_606920 [Fimicolochytrium jonesii]
MAWRPRPPTVATTAAESTFRVDEEDEEEVFNGIEIRMTNNGFYPSHVVTTVGTTIRIRWEMDRKQRLAEVTAANSCRFTNRLILHARGRGYAHWITLDGRHEHNYMAFTGTTARPNATAWLTIVAKSDDEENEEDYVDPPPQVAAGPRARRALVENGPLMQSTPLRPVPGPIRVAGVLVALPDPRAFQTQVATDGEDEQRPVEETPRACTWRGTPFSLFLGKRLVPWMMLLGMCGKRRLPPSSSAGPKQGPSSTPKTEKAAGAAPVHAWETPTAQSSSGGITRPTNRMCKVSVFPACLQPPPTRPRPHPSSPPGMGGDARASGRGRRIIRVASGCGGFRGDVGRLDGSTEAGGGAHVVGGSVHADPASEGSGPQNVGLPRGGGPILDEGDELVFRGGGGPILDEGDELVFRVGRGGQAMEGRVTITRKSRRTARRPPLIWGKTFVGGGWGDLALIRPLHGGGSPQRSADRHRRPRHWGASHRQPHLPPPAPSAARQRHHQPPNPADSPGITPPLSHSPPTSPPPLIEATPLKDCCGGAVFHHPAQRSHLRLALARVHASSTEARQRRDPRNTFPRGHIARAAQTLSSINIHKEGEQAAAEAAAAVATSAPPPFTFGATAASSSSTGIAADMTAKPGFPSLGISVPSTTTTEASKPAAGTSVEEEEDEDLLMMEMAMRVSAAGADGDFGLQLALALSTAEYEEPSVPCTLCRTLPPLPRCTLSKTILRITRLTDLPMLRALEGIFPDTSNWGNARSHTARTAVYAAKAAFCDDISVGDRVAEGTSDGDTGMRYSSSRVTHALPVSGQARIDRLRVYCFTFPARPICSYEDLHSIPAIPASFIPFV